MENKSSYYTFSMALVAFALLGIANTILQVSQAFPFVVSWDLENEELYTRNV